MTTGIIDPNTFADDESRAYEAKKAEFFADGNGYDKLQGMLDQVVAENTGMTFKSSEQRAREDIQALEDKKSIEPDWLRPLISKVRKHIQMPEGSHEEISLGKNTRVNTWVVTLSPPWPAAAKQDPRGDIAVDVLGVENILFEEGGTLDTVATRLGLVFTWVSGIRRVELHIAWAPFDDHKH